LIDVTGAVVIKTGLGVAVGTVAAIGVAAGLAGLAGVDGLAAGVAAGVGTVGTTLVTRMVGAGMVTPTAGDTGTGGVLITMTGGGSIGSGAGAGAGVEVETTGSCSPAESICAVGNTGVATIGAGARGIGGLVGFVALETGLGGRNRLALAVGGGEVAKAFPGFAWISG
jgi:hypothetical protein